VDVTVINGGLAGVLVILAAVWGWYVRNRLWQQSIVEDAAEAIEGAVQMGLILNPLGYGARVVAAGVLSGKEVKLVWSGGIWGARTRLYVDDAIWKVPFCTGLRALETLLIDAGALTPPEPDPSDDGSEQADGELEPPVTA
jgi:hypothetical protein